MHASSGSGHELWCPGEEWGTGRSQEAIGGETPELRGWCCQDLAPAGIPSGSCLCTSQLPNLCAGFQAPGCSGSGSSGDPRARKPRGRHPLQNTFGVCDAEATRSWDWPTLEAAGGRSRTLCHPSFQSLFSAVSSCNSSSGPPPPGGLASSSAREAGPLQLMDSSSCFYTDPTLLPGCRIYNGLSASSRDVLRHLQLNTPAPVMAVREAPSPPPPTPRTSRLWLSEPELSALLALLELPDAEGRTTAGDCGEQLLHAPGHS